MGGVVSSVGDAFGSVGDAIGNPWRTGRSSAERKQKQAVAEQRREVDRQRAAEEARQRRIAQGKQQLNQIFGGLTQGANPLWEQHEQAYLDYANPQLQDQYGDAREGLGYTLARQGQLSSSLAGERFADLSRDNQIQQGEIADRARGYGNRARQNISDQRQSLMALLQSSADPSATSSQARSAVSSLQERPSFTALGPLFQNVTAGLGAARQGMQNGRLQQKTQGIMYGGDPDRESGRVIR